MSRVTSKGQATIPVELRYALGIEPGDELVFWLDGERAGFRRSDGALGRRATLAAAARPESRGLERLLTTGDEAFEGRIREARATRTHVRLPDAVLLDLLGRLSAAGVEADDAADALRDVLAERALRFDHPRALRAAIDALVTDGDAMAAYVAARA